ncbi:helix-turn-helix domain-containing protein [Paraburkholderia sp.]|uniref:helix-turn-helix domain-containing protein n=1 Tax=Paraburkholderia sp. TaxID=1926495 RepID=UPI00344A3A00
MELRLERCATWLLDPRYAHKSIEQVAAACGFKSASHFSRMFRERHGLSPREYKVQSSHTSDGENARR